MVKTILIVDDEPRTREGVRKVLTAWSAGQHQILTAANGVEALSMLEEHEVHVLITDIRMPQISGLELIETVVSRPRAPVIILISGYAEFEYAQKALKAGAIEYLLKPLEKGKLIQAVELALEREAERTRISRMSKLVDNKLMETVEQEGTYSPVVQDTIRYVDVHLKEPLQLRDIADHLHVNASYLSVLFKEQMGMTFTEYLTRRRIQRAKELLTNTRMTIAEIAEAAGYQTDKYFVKVFRSVEGMSPGHYRKSMVDPDPLIIRDSDDR
jgi:YesN/AraC family two-component response regulator